MTDLNEDVVSGAPSSDDNLAPADELNAGEADKPSKDPNAPSAEKVDLTDPAKETATPKPETQPAPEQARARPKHEIIPTLDKKATFELRSDTEKHLADVLGRHYTVYKKMQEEDRNRAIHGERPILRTDQIAFLKDIEGTEGFSADKLGETAEAYLGRQDRLVLAVRMAEEEKAILQMATGKRMIELATAEPGRFIAEAQRIDKQGGASGIEPNKSLQSQVAESWLTKQGGVRKAVGRLAGLLDLPFGMVKDVATQVTDATALSTDVLNRLRDVERQQAENRARDYDVVLQMDIKTGETVTVDLTKAGLTPNKIAFLRALYDIPANRDMMNLPIQEIRNLDTIMKDTTRASIDFYTSLGVMDRGRIGPLLNSIDAAGNYIQLPVGADFLLSSSRRIDSSTGQLTADQAIVQSRVEIMKDIASKTQKELADVLAKKGLESTYVQIEKVKDDLARPNAMTPEEQQVKVQEKEAVLNKLRQEKTKVEETKAKQAENVQLAGDKADLAARLGADIPHYIANPRDPESIKFFELKKQGVERRISQLEKERIAQQESLKTLEAGKPSAGKGQAPSPDVQKAYQDNLTKIQDALAKVTTDMAPLLANLENYEDELAYRQHMVEQQKAAIQRYQEVSALLDDNERTVASSLRQYGQGTPLTLRDPAVIGAEIKIEEKNKEGIGKPDEFASQQKETYDTFLQTVGSKGEHFEEIQNRANEAEAANSRPAEFPLWNEAANIYTDYPSAYIRTLQILGGPTVATGGSENEALFAKLAHMLPPEQFLKSFNKYLAEKHLPLILDAQGLEIKISALVEKVDGEFVNILLTEMEQDALRKELGKIPLDEQTQLREMKNHTDSIDLNAAIALNISPVVVDLYNTLHENYYYRDIDDLTRQLVTEFGIDPLSTIPVDIVKMKDVKVYALLIDKLRRG